ncbi:MAG TPA: hypothetical protein VLF66_12035, partial [Thermoanaerobaculia bacterium]|nr:hypothetical protein [Thermoanaerobaculia bacterium]
MQDQIVKRLVERVEDGGILFLVGSGISSPAGLPTAAELLEATVQRYLPSNHPEVPRVLDLIQPEVFYEELALFLGEDAFRAFISLTNEDVEPTLAHYLLVTLAARASLPIVTTNFDCLFERASHDLG